MDGQMLDDPLQTGEDRQAIIDALAASAAELGRNIVDVAGLLDDMAAQAEQQRGLVSQAEGGAAEVNAANHAVRQAACAVSDSARGTMGSVEASVDLVSRAGARTRDVVSWVHSLAARMADIEAALLSINKSNVEIVSIASQINILAINSKIEASRAGEAGRGFAFLAEAVSDLSHKTAATADQIRGGIRNLSGGIAKLRDEASEISGVATTVLADGADTDTVLRDIPKQIMATVMAADDISQRAEQVEAAARDFGPVFAKITTGFSDTADRIGVAKRRANGLIDASESIVQGTAALGANTEDRRFITSVQDLADRIGMAFEAGIAQRQISESHLFTHRYRVIEGSNPEQMLAPFTAFTDRVLPPIQEGALKLSDKVVFCASVDVNGYLPTHNRKFSQRQGHDPIWNAAHCRNRRLFNDRVGLKAGRSTADFLLQVYRRDMGGGVFALMKDLSAPIYVGDRHWGGVRLAYKF